MNARRWTALGAVVFLSVIACSDDDVSPPPMADGSGGANGMGSGGKSSGSGGTDVDEDAASPTEDSGSEPSVPKRVTFLHGMTDSPWIAFCFARVEDGVERPLTGEWMPTNGLEYGYSRTTDSLPGVTFGVDTWRPYVVAARSRDVVEGLDCAAIARLVAETTNDEPDASVDGGTVSPSDAGTVEAGLADAGTDADVDAAPPPPPPPPPVAAVRMVGLPVVTAAALERDASYLLGVFGCMGGRGVTHPSEQSICGVDYAVARTTLTETLVRLSSRTDPEAVGLQFLVGTPAFGRSDLRIVRGSAGDILEVASDVNIGALRPVEPYFGATAFELSPTSSIARVQVYAAGGSLAAYDDTWAPTLAPTARNVLPNGATYTLVLAGPTPGFGQALWWNKALVTLVPNAPLR